MKLLLRSVCRWHEVVHMKIRLTLSLTFLLVGFVGASAVVAVQGPPSPLGIVPTPTPQPLTINVWTDKSTYTVGETMRVYFNVNQPAYIYLYDIQPDGVVRLVFPNAYSQSNFVSAGTHGLPDHPSYRYTVTYPTGVEKLQIFASQTPLALSPSTYAEPFPMATPDQIQGHIMGITPEPVCQPSWATAWASFTITAPPPTCYTPPTPSYTPPPCYKPTPPYFPFFGFCFPGGSWYQPRVRCSFGIRIRIGCCDP